MRTLIRPMVVLGTALILVGCSSPQTVSQSPAPAGTPSAEAPAPSPAPSTAPSPAADGPLKISLDGLAYNEADVPDAAPFSDGAAVVALMERVADAPPEVTEIPQKGFTSYAWEGVLIFVNEAGQARARFTAPALGGVRLETTGGIAVGSSRAEAVASGAVDGYDSNGDGIAERLTLDSREAPGTTSLADPGLVGSDYIELTVDGDVVTGVTSPADDWSDL
ncbi:hypothetical protein [Naasia lichenicola]|uniref:Uncharacterized protein n=1 Tax=Naasia lichenicola TaxID=2565933 RepID=A0A4S4FFF4_9MICO|nr:hypothetical protein [Naasia lichenicola]THG28452.1 hypothetical protein E6C64_16620 [Naasia lichenicola]